LRSLLLLKNFVLCLAPVVVHGADLQIFLLSIILLIFLHIQLSLAPWRSRVPNLTDGALNF
jgi:hypothetical protein